MQKRVRMLLSGFGGSLLLSGGAGAEQPVWLDFITDSDPGEHVYTAGEQTQIRDRIAADYSSFDF